MHQRDETAGSESERGRESNGGQEHWHGGFERQPGSRWRAGRERDESFENRFRPVTEEWEAAPGQGAGPNELGYGGGRGRYEERRGGEGRYSTHRYRDPDRSGREDRHGWGASASQPYYGPRSQWRDRPSQDPYGFGQRSQGHEPPFERETFGRRDDLAYYGTGAPGWGGFTGGANVYDYGPFNPRPPQLEGEYSDESAVSYERESHGDYGRGSRRTQQRQYPPGPKGYQRSDERLKEDISERLMESHRIDSSEVTVEVQSAKVILEGTVPSRYMKQAIEDLVDRCPGVKDIDNRVRVASPNYQGSTQ